MRKKPVRHENNDRKNTKLADSTGCENSDDSQDTVVGYYFESIGSACMAETLSNTLFNGECDGGFCYSVDLEVRRMRKG